MKLPIYVYLYVAHLIILLYSSIHHHELPHMRAAAYDCISLLTPIVPHDLASDPI